MLADLAAALLASNGIEAHISADDAGGTYPVLQLLQGVRLLVESEDEARAREILEALPAWEGLDEEQGIS